MPWTEEAPVVRTFKNTDAAGVEHVLNLTTSVSPASVTIDYLMNGNLQGNITIGEMATIKEMFTEVGAAI